VRQPVPYVLIHDDLDKDGKAHRYDFTVHVPHVDETALSERGRPFATVQDERRRAIGSIEVFHPSDVRHEVQSYETYHDPYRHHRVLHFETTAVNPRFLVLMLPLVEGAERPVVDVEETNGALNVTLQWSANVDAITFAHDEGLLPTMSRGASGGSPVVWGRRFEYDGPGFGTS
jgi:hypothetical protein